MALPRIISVTFKRRRTLSDGKVLVVFKVEDDAVGARGYMRVVADSSAIADDLDNANIATFDLT